MKSNPAVLFIIFNRPEVTRITFERIRRARPRRLYVHADGARATHPNDAARCAASRQIIDSVDWPCEVKRLFRDQNLGCGPAVSGALNWFFDQEEEGVIIEDDCSPMPGFFEYCQLMLDRYRDAPAVMHISGCGIASKYCPAGADGYLAPFPFIWGWASWRRAWQHYRFELPAESDVAEILAKQNPGGNFVHYWREKFEAVRTGEINTWDYQWVLSVWRAGGLAVTPVRSFVENIGAGPDATHPQGSENGFAPVTSERFTPASPIASVDTEIALREIHDQLFNPLARQTFWQRWVTHTAWFRWVYLGLRNRLRPTGSTPNRT